MYNFGNFVTGLLKFLRKN